MKYPHLAARLYNSPLLVHPDKAAVIEEVFRSHLKGEAKPAGHPDEIARPEAALGAIRFRPQNDKPYAITEGGVALIPIVGTLVQRGDALDAQSGLIGYNRIGRKLAAALDDHEVKGVVLEIDSPGGEANGCFDLAERILEARGDKPIWAVANEQAFSAAYALACSAERLTVPPTGLVGSIGVIAMHVDQSKRDSAQGYAYTAVFAGARKNDFSSHAPLSERAESTLQTEVDRLYDIFVAHVASARNIDPKAVRFTEAGLLDPQEALAKRLVDGIATLSETVAELEAKVHSSSAFRASPPPSGPVGQASSASETGQSTLSHDHPDLYSRGLQRAVETGIGEENREAFATEFVSGIIEERQRVAAILKSSEARGRECLARYIALESNLSVADALRTLSKAALDSSQASSSFMAAMSALRNPEVGPDAPESDDRVASGVSAQAIFEARAKKSKGH